MHCLGAEGRMPRGVCGWRRRWCSHTRPSLVLCSRALLLAARKRRVMLTSVESTIKMGGVLTLIKQIGALFSLPALVAQRCYPSVLGGRAAELCSAGRVPSVGVENAPILSLQSLRATQRNPSSPGR